MEAGEQAAEHQLKVALEGGRTLPRDATGAPGSLTQMLVVLQTVRCFFFPLIKSRVSAWFCRHLVIAITSENSTRFDLNPSF